MEIALKLWRLVDRGVRFAGDLFVAMVLVVFLFALVNWLYVNLAKLF